MLKMETKVEEKLLMSLQIVDPSPPLSGPLSRPSWVR